MFARKKKNSPTNKLAICWPRCSPGILGDLGVLSYPNRFFLFLQACSSGWPSAGPRGRMREWELDPIRCKSTADGLFLPWLGRIERFCVFWCVFFFQNRQNAADRFFFWLKKQFPTSSTRNNRALILIGASGCHCHANREHAWCLLARFRPHIGRLQSAAAKIPSCLSPSNPF